ncbi:zinc finger MYM-type protein 6 [Trichonephila clavipes]|nr:zinc finger MYM-type protein 6 [Trichonephila clavipes]
MSRNIESEVIKRIQNPSVFALQLAKSLTWANCVAVRTDGAAASTGLSKGLRGLIQKVVPHMVFNHCMIHRQALVAKDMYEELHNILQDAVNSINYIKCNSLKSRLFSILCNEMGSTYDRLLLHTEVRWLSRGKILRRIFDLRNEVYAFLSEKKHRLVRYINEVWLGKLSCLVDIFEKLNDLNLSWQDGKETQILRECLQEIFRAGVFLPIIDNLVAQLNKRRDSYEVLNTRFEIFGNLHEKEQEVTKQAKYLAQSYPKDINEEQFGQECQHLKMYMKVEK